MAWRSCYLFFVLDGYGHFYVNVLEYSYLLGNLLVDFNWNINLYWNYFSHWDSTFL